MSGVDWSGICEQALGEFTAAALPPTLKLPALPHAVTLFLERSGKPNVVIKELSSIVETDTGLSLELLRHVNSAFVGLRNKARTVLQALTLLGLRPSKMFLITTGMQAAVQARQSKMINQSCFWNATLQKALFARHVAGMLKADQDLAFAGALLQDYLLPVLTNDLYEGYVNFVSTRDSQPINMCEYEQSTFGWNHALAGACLARRWKLPDELVCCILYHHHGLQVLAHPQLGRTAVAAVALSGLLPDQLRQCYRGLEQLMLLEEKWPAFKLQEIAAIVDKEHANIGMNVQNDYPLSRRCKPAINKDSSKENLVAAAMA